MFLRTAHRLPTIANGESPSQAIPDNGATTPLKLNRKSKEPAKQSRRRKPPQPPQTMLDAASFGAAANQRSVRAQHTSRQRSPPAQQTTTPSASPPERKKCGAAQPATPHSQFVKRNRYFATIFTRRPRTTMTFFKSLPSTAAFTASRATAFTSSSAASAATVMRAFTLPLT